MRSLWKSGVCGRAALQGRVKRQKEKGPSGPGKLTPTPQLRNHRSPPAPGRVLRGGCHPERRQSRREGPYVGGYRRCSKEEHHDAGIVTMIFNNMGPQNVANSWSPRRWTKGGRAALQGRVKRQREKGPSGPGKFTPTPRLRNQRPPPPPHPRNPPSPRRAAHPSATNT